VAVEARFEEKLAEALRSCAAGYIGMFGRNDAVLDAHYGRNSWRMKSEDARQLLEMVDEIASRRAELGYVEPNPLCARYLEYRARHKANDPGEDKLATEFLAELEDGLRSSPSTARMASRKD